MPFPPAFLQMVCAEHRYGSTCIKRSLVQGHETKQSHVPIAISFNEDTHTASLFGIGNEQLETMWHNIPIAVSFSWHGAHTGYHNLHWSWVYQAAYVQVEASDPLLYTLRHHCHQICLR